VSEVPAATAAVTINTTQPLDRAGPKLVAFLRLLRARYGVGRASLVGWSYGGPVSRAAIRLLRDSGSSITMTSLITLGSPWTGMYPNGINMGDAPISICRNQPTCVAIVRGAGFGSGPQLKAGVVGQLTAKRMTAWNAQQVGVLDAVPLAAIGDDAERFASGPPSAWPNDALVQLPSALDTDVPPAVVPRITRLTFDDVHSATMVWQGRMVLGKAVALTEDPKVLEAMVQAVRAAV